MSRVLRTIALSLLVIVLALAALTARAMLEGRRELAESDAAFDQGDLHGATEHARRAAVLYAPGAPHVPKAYARLTAIAVGAEAAGDRREAESAWRAIRGAALETRHLWIPERAHLARANEALARLAEYPWPGNVRELRNAVEQAQVMASGEVIEASDLFLHRRKAARARSWDEGLPYNEAKRQATEHFERTYLLEALRRHEGNISRTAETIGLARQSLQQKIKELDLRSEDWT